MTTIIDKLDTIGNFNNSIKGIGKFNSNYKGINEISVINDKREGRILKNKQFELAKDLQNTLRNLKKVVDGVNKFTRTDLNVLKEISKNTGPAAPVTAPVVPTSEREPVNKAAERAKAMDAYPEAAASVKAAAAVTGSEVETPSSESQQYPNTPIEVEGKVGLTPEQDKEFNRINKNIDKEEDKIDINNYPKIPPTSTLIRWGDNPIWMGKIYKNELNRKFGDDKYESANVFMKNDGYMVVDYTPRNPMVTLIGTGENADIKKNEGKYVLLKNIKLNKDNNPEYVEYGKGDEDKGGYGFEFVYKGAGNTFLSLFGNEKSGGKKKSKSKRTKKNGSLKKRK